MNSADEFLATGEKFKLGVLETEKPNPLTMNLSNLAQNDLRQAVQVLASVDIQALEILKSKIESVITLRKAILSVWSSGGRVFLCGCGATGRLSIALEVLSRRPDRVIGFMAGGDVALVHSLEGFEDYPEYGERHLQELGFKAGDLLIASTEGGETPYVIGATEWASRQSKHSPFILYCNPDEILVNHVARSKKFIENNKIQKINLSVGPMALAGSTRMQASTVIQLAIGFALLTDFDSRQIDENISLMQNLLRENAHHFLPPFIEREASEYLAERYIMYSVQDYAITVFTDTTERAPTFSLTPFSHPKATRLLKLKPSKSFISIAGAKNKEEAWKVLLGREPRPLNWLDIDERTGTDYLSEFDFSQNAFAFRKWLTAGTDHSIFEIFKHDGGLLWRFQDVESSLILPENSTPLFEHLLLKMLINMHSTLVMGRLGRYKRNLMTWVYPTNGKLIDRTARYAQVLLQEEGVTVSYEKVVREIFAQKNKISANESIVLAVYNELKK